MKRLKLTKGLSFCMMNFSCKKGKPFCVDDEKAEKLLSTGRFEMLGVVCGSLKTEGNVRLDEKQSLIAEDFPNSQNDNMNDGEETKKTDDDELTTELIEKMRKDELITLAEKEGIDISECKNNEERAEKIKGVLGLLGIDPLFKE